MTRFAGSVTTGRERPMDAAALAETLRHDAEDAFGAWNDDHISLSASVRRVSPSSADDDEPWIDDATGVVAVFDGRLDERADVLPLLPRPQRLRNEPDVALIASLVAEHGDKLLSRLRGDFAFAAYDPRKGTTVLARDALGVRPLYLRRSDDVVSFASEGKALLYAGGEMPRPNVSLLGEFILGGSPRASAWSTFFEDIVAVPPGVVVRIDKDGVHWRQYLDFDVEARTRLPSYDAYVDAYRELFLQSVRRRSTIETPLGILVSGGLDSSSVLGSIEYLRAQGHQMPDVVPVTNTFPIGSAGDESTYIEALERHFGLKVSRLRMSHADIAARSVQQTWTTETPTINEAWASQLELWSFLRDRGVRRYMTGLWGDQVLVNQTYLVDLLDRGRLLTIARHIHGFRTTMVDVDPDVFVRGLLSDLVRWHLPRALIPPLRAVRARTRGPRHDRPWFTAKLREPASLPTTARMVGGWAKPTAHSRSAHARIRSVYYGYGLSLEGIAAESAGMDTLTPYLDFDLLSFLISVPGEVITPDGRSRGLHRDAMVGIVPDTIRERTSKGDGTRFGSQSVAEQLSDIRSWLGNTSSAGEMGLLDDATFRSWMTHAAQQLTEAADFDAALSVLDVVGLEAWLRAYWPNATGSRMAGDGDARAQEGI